MSSRVENTEAEALTENTTQVVDGEEEIEEQADQTEDLVDEEESARPLFTAAGLHFSMSAAFAFLGIFTVLFYIFGPGIGYMHSDCTDTILWAQASYDSGKWISPTFYYAAQLPFGGNLLMLPFIPFFGVSITTHSLGMTLFLILFVISIFLACRAAGLSLSYRLDCIGLTLLVISSSKKMWEIFWGHVIYYSLGAMFLFYGFAILIAVEKRYREKKLTWYALALAGLYFMLVALDGSQMLILVTLPLLAGFFLERFFDAESPINCRENLALGVVAVLLAVSSLLGLIWLFGILQAHTAGYADAYSVWSAMSDWPQHVLDLPNAWFKLFGLEINERKPMFSLVSVGYLLRLVSAIVIAILPIGLMIRYKHIKDRPLKIFLWMHVVLSAAIVFAFIFGLLYTANWRLSPIIASGLLLLFFTLYYEIRKRSIAQRLIVLVTVPLALTALLNSAVILGKGFYYNRDNDVYKVADFLEQNDLTYGYASFWNSQLITVYTGEKVKARNVSFNDLGIQHELYQASSEWFGPQEGVDRYFILMSSPEFKTWSNSETGQIELERAIDIHKNIYGFVIVVVDHDL
ncbi:MAG: hypothetical protein IKX10_03500 [Lachnospiraceae bacterium]|nr:hypothetical protein [Lachnospiraceae bacterium]